MNVCFSQNVPTNVQIEQDKRANTPVPFTLGDRDRLLKLEMMQSSMKEEMNNMKEEMNNMKEEIKGIKAEIKSMKEEIQEIKAEILVLKTQFNYIETLIYVLIGMMGGLITFVYWDRRTFVKPLEEKVLGIEKEVYQLTNSVQQYMQQVKQHGGISENLWKSLKELAKTNDALQQVLKQHNLL